jgi:hypothetical protein
MTSRTFPLSRQRRRRIVSKPPLVPVQDGERLAAPAVERDLGDELERQPSPQRTAAGEPVDDATRDAGARPAAARLPHEHDEYADAPQRPRPVMAQAQADIAAGLEDTDCRNAAAGRAFASDGKKGGRCP